MPCPYKVTKQTSFFICCIINNYAGYTLRVQVLCGYLMPKRRG